MSLSRVVRNDGVVRGFSRGLDFVQGSWHSILLLSLLATAVRSLLLLSQEPPELSAANKFLFQCALLVVDSWLFVAAATLAVAHLRGEIVPVRTVAVRSFIFLPKTFFSYMLCGAFLVFSLFLPLFLPLGVLFVWMPFFVTGELFAKEEARPAGADPEEYQPEDEDEPALFLRKPVFDLGIARAFRFGLRNYQFTLQALIFPLAVYFFSMAITHFFFSVVKIEEMGILSGFVSTILWTALTISLFQAFLLSLPRESVMEELGIDTRTQSSSPVRRWVGDLFSSWLPLLLLVGIGLASLGYLLQYKIKNTPLDSLEKSAAEKRGAPVIALLSLDANG